MRNILNIHSPKSNDDQFKKLKEKNQMTLNLIQKKYKKWISQYQSVYCKNVIFIGNTSSGKSRLLNKLFGLKLITGRGQTNLNCHCVYNIKNKINIFNSVGYNNQSHKDTQKYRQQLAQINSCHLVFICFDGSLKSLSDLVEIICKSRDRMYQVAFVYTKCDLVEPQENSITQCILRERKYLGQLGIKNAQRSILYEFSEERPILRTIKLELQDSKDDQLVRKEVKLINEYYKQQLNQVQICIQQVLQSTQSHQTTLSQSILPHFLGIGN